MEHGREHHSERLDRIEVIIAAGASRHAENENEFVRLLKAQAAFQEAVVTPPSTSIGPMDRGESAMDRVERNLAEATDRINALVARMKQHRQTPPAN